MARINTQVDRKLDHAMANAAKALGVTKLAWQTAAVTDGLAATDGKPIDIAPRGDDYITIAPPFASAEVEARFAATAAERGVKKGALARTLMAMAAAAQGFGDTPKAMAIRIKARTGASETPNLGFAAAQTAAPKAKAKGPKRDSRGRFVKRG